MWFSVTQNIIEWFDITRKLHNVYYQRSHLCMQIKIIGVLCWVLTQVKPKTTTLEFAASQIIT